MLGKTGGLGAGSRAHAAASLEEQRSKAQQPAWRTLPDLHSALFLAAALPHRLGYVFAQGQAVTLCGHPQPDHRGAGGWAGRRGGRQVLGGWFVPFWGASGGSSVASQDGSAAVILLLTALARLPTKCTPGFVPAGRAL